MTHDGYADLCSEFRRDYIAKWNDLKRSARIFMKKIKMSLDISFRCISAITIINLNSIIFSISGGLSMRCVTETCINLDKHFAETQQIFCTTFKPRCQCLCIITIACDATCKWLRYYVLVYRFYKTVILLLCRGVFFVVVALVPKLLAFLYKHFVVVFSLLFGITY